MRLLPITLVLPLLTGCVPLGPWGYMTIWPYTSERSAAISGTLLDERTRTPVAGADVFFTYFPQLHSKSDRDGSFKISATRYHSRITGYGPGGKVESHKSPLYP